MLTVAFGESTMRGTQVQLLYYRIKEGREGINNDARPGSLSTSTTDENSEAVKKKIFNFEFESLLKRLMIILAYFSGHAKQFLQTF